MEGSSGVKCSLLMGSFVTALICCIVLVMCTMSVPSVRVKNETKVVDVYKYNWPHKFSWYANSNLRAPQFCWASSLFVDFILKIELLKELSFFWRFLNYLRQQTTFSAIRNLLIGKHRKESNPWVRRDRTSDICNQTRGAFCDKIKNSRSSAQWINLVTWFSVWREQT